MRSRKANDQATPGRSDSLEAFHQEKGRLRAPHGPVMLPYNERVSRLKGGERSFGLGPTIGNRRYCFIGENHITSGSLQREALSIARLLARAYTAYPTRAINSSFFFALLRRVPFWGLCGEFVVKAAVITARWTTRP
jgi:hypothetical protein